VWTDGDDECSITILLRSAILIASEALIITYRVVQKWTVFES